MDGVAWPEYRDLEYGYDWAFAPVRPLDPEYRQSYSEAQRKWLEQWCPRVQDYIQ